MVPRAHQEAVLNLVHSSPTDAHMGGNRTWVRARNNFWWPGMKEDVGEFIAKCKRCSMNKHLNRPNKAPMEKAGMPAKPLEEIMVDFVGPFPSARAHPFRYVLQVQDVFSRYILFIPCEDATAITAANAVMDRWVCLFGAPEIIRSDRGTHFTAEIFTDLCQLMGIKHRMGSPEHPESQGQVERQNQLMNQVRSLCENNIEKWPDALYKVQYSHNSSINATTGFTPARLLLGKELIVPDDIITTEVDCNRPQMDTVENQVRARSDDDEEIFQIARGNVKEIQTKRAEIQDENMFGKAYKLGDHVRYKLNPDAKNRMGGKIAPRYIPRHTSVIETYRVIEVKPNNYTYVLEPVDGNSRGRKKERHFNQLKTVDRKEIETNEVSAGLDPGNAQEGSRSSDERQILRRNNVPEVQTPDEGRSECDQVRLPTDQNNMCRKSSRNRRKTEFLQADGSKKVYGTSGAIDLQLSEGDIDA